MRTLDILDTINGKLVERWPERTVYVDVCPVDFDRPSFWLAVEQDEQTDANRFLVRHDIRLKLTIYDQLDEHYDASWYRPAGESDAVMELLTPVLQVGSRHLKLNLKALPREADRSFLQITASWMDDRPGLSQSEEPPPADSYSLRVRGSIES